MSISPWLPAVVALLLGLGAGGWAVLRLRREPETDPSGDSSLALDEEIAVGVAALRELDEQREQSDPAAYARKRAELEAHAAQCLRRRDEAASRVASRQSPPKRYPRLVGFAWGAAILGVILFFYGPLTRSPEPVLESAGSAGPGPDHGSNDELQELMQRLSVNPNDVEALTSVARRFATAGAWQDARRMTERALATDPEHVEALVLLAVVQANTGEAPRALATIDNVLQKDPRHADAWLTRGMIGMALENPALTRESYARFVEVGPDGPTKDRVRQALAMEP